MNKNEFRIMHSKIIQECIGMEDRLRTHYGLIYGKNSLDEFIKYTDFVDENSLGQLVAKLKKVKEKYPTNLFEELDNAVQIRNYYAHRVFYHHNPFNFDNVRKYDQDKIIKEYSTIKDINTKLDDIYEKIHESYKKNNSSK